MRFRRFLSTARRAHFFEIANPRRAAVQPFPRARTVKQLSTDFAGCANTFRKSPGRRSRAGRRKRSSTIFPRVGEISLPDVLVPSPCAPSVPCAHSLWPCVHEIRGSLRALCDSAGRFFSFLDSHYVGAGCRFKFMEQRLPIIFFAGLAVNA